MDQSPFELLDFFCGKARISQLAVKAGFHVASFDLGIPGGTRMHRFREKAKRPFRAAMDWNGDAGFALLGGMESDFGVSC